MLSEDCQLPKARSWRQLQRVWLDQTSYNVKPVSLSNTYINFKLRVQNHSYHDIAKTIRDC